jgi:hypothetical protein
MRWLAVFLLAVISLSGCAVPRAAVDEAGKLDVLGPTRDFAAGGLPGDWVIEGEAARDQLAVAERAGVPALRLINGEKGFVLVRRTRALLLATPYLSWSWNVDDHGQGNHPVRLIVGFWGGNPDSASWGSRPLVGLGTSLPPHDRSLAIAWADSALKRGSLVLPSAGKRHVPLYVLRGGRENAGIWWFETADLADLYRRLWPNDRIERVQVMFIGLAVAGGRPIAPAYVSGLRLSR